MHQNNFLNNAGLVTFQF